MFDEKIRVFSRRLKVMRRQCNGEKISAQATIASYFPVRARVFAGNGISNAPGTEYSRTPSERRPDPQRDEFSRAFLAYLEMCYDAAQQVAPFMHSAFLMRQPEQQIDTAPAPKKARAAPSAASVRRRQRQIEEKRSVILSAALQNFALYGFHGTSVDMVSQTADVSKSNLLYYFKSKEDLYTSLLRDLLAQWMAPLKTFSSEEDPEKAIRGYIHNKLLSLRDNPAASRVFCMEVVQGAHNFGEELMSELKSVVDEKTKTIEDWISMGKLRPISPHHLIFLLWSTSQHYADFAFQVSALTGKDLSDAAFFTEVETNLCEIVLSGVMPR